MSGPGENQISKPFDAATMCGAHKRRARVGCTAPDTSKCFEPGHLCQRRKGHGTDHRGVGKCQFHGGNSPNGQKFAAREVVEVAVQSAIQRLGVRVATDPLTALQEVLDSANGAHLASEALVQEVAAMDPDSKALHAALRYHGEAMDRLARIAKETVDTNIAERRASIEEAEVRRFVETIKTAIARSGIPAEHRLAVERSIAAVIRGRAELPE